MSNPISACIYIGGTLMPAALPALVDAIVASGVGIGHDYDGDRATPDSVLDELRRADLYKRPAAFHDEKADWGHFKEIESACRTHGLAYCVEDEGDVEFDPGCHYWLPHMDGELSVRCNRAGEPVLGLGEIRRLLERGLDVLMARIAVLDVPEIPALVLADD